MSGVRMLHFLKEIYGNSLKIHQYYTMALSYFLVLEIHFLKVTTQWLNDLLIWLLDWSYLLFKNVILSIWWQLGPNSVTARYSEGSLFWRFEYSEGSLFRRFVIPKVSYSEGSLFRRSVIPQVRESENKIGFVNPKMK